MIEARIAYYCTCDFCGGRARTEVPAIVQTLVWKQALPEVRLPEGWWPETVISSSGRVEKHRCAECVAKKAGTPVEAPPLPPGEPPREVTDAAAGLAARTPEGERS